MPAFSVTYVVVYADILTTFLPIYPLIHSFTGLQVSYNQVVMQQKPLASLALRSMQADATKGEPPPSSVWHTIVVRLTSAYCCIHRAIDRLSSPIMYGDNTTDAGC